MTNRQREERYDRLDRLAQKWPLGTSVRMPDRAEGIVVTWTLVGEQAYLDVVLKAGHNKLRVLPQNVKRI